MSLSSIKTANAVAKVAGKQAVVVGATAGIGKGVAVRLAQSDVSVTIIGRNEKRGQEVVKELKASGKGEHNFVQMDASLLKNAAQFAKDYAKTHDKLDYLVLSQGIATFQGYTPTEEDLDVKLALHYYSRVAFAAQLAPLLEKSDDARVLSVLSGGIHSAYANYEKDPDLSKNYGLKDVADAAGFYNDIAADKFTETFPKITFIHQAPGFIASSWGTDLPWYAKGPTRFLQLFATSVETCAEYMVNSLFNDKFKGGFHILLNKGGAGKPTPLHEQAKDFVWQHTLEVLQRCIGNDFVLNAVNASTKSKSSNSKQKK